MDINESQVFDYDPSIDSLHVSCVQLRLRTTSHMSVVHLLQASQSVSQSVTRHNQNKTCLCCLYTIVSHQPIEIACLHPSNGWFRWCQAIWTRLTNCATLIGWLPFPTCHSRSLQFYAGLWLPIHELFRCNACNPVVISRLFISHTQTEYQLPVFQKILAKTFAKSATLLWNR